ncbi:hypothetical protein AAMO2058_001221400 [Amorphochlora amoebiformis]
MSDDKPSLSFSDSITILEFPRLQAGSSGVPTSGGFSLGLAWGEPTRVNLPFLEFESKRAHIRRIYPTANSIKRLPKLGEKRRRELLVKGGGMGQGRGEAKDLEVIRQERKHVGCVRGCSCSDSTCACIQSGVECYDDSGMWCGCKKFGCQNKNGRYSYDYFATVRYRQKVLKRVNASKKVLDVKK